MTDPTLPYFVYGTLQPTELGFEQISDLVTNTQSAYLPDHLLFVRDGLPGARRPTREDLQHAEEDLKYAPRMGVQGFILTVREGKEEELRARLDSFEPSSLYTRPQRVKARLLDETEVDVYTHELKQPARGRPVCWGRNTWSVAEDPLFRYGLPTTCRLIKDHQQAIRASRTRIPDDPSSGPFWSYYVPILGYFQVLCSVLERFLTLTRGVPPDPGASARRVGPYRKSINQQLTDLCDDAPTSELLAALDLSAPPNGREIIFSTKDVEDSQEWSVNNAWHYWYQVRSNAVHRGKAVGHDAELITWSAESLGDALTALLKSRVPALAAAWRTRSTTTPVPRQPDSGVTRGELGRPPMPGDQAAG